MARLIASLAVIFFISSICLVSSGSGIAFASDAASPSPALGLADQADAPETLSVIWNDTYGGPGPDEAYSVIKVDNGYVVAGTVGGHVCLLKTDLNGNQVWRKTYGGKGDDEARSLIAVDDGFVIAGYSSSYENGGVYDVYLLKTDFDGNLVWYKTYESMLHGHLTNAFGKSVVATGDGYAIVGETNADSSGGLDVYLLKTDIMGNLAWSKTYGGSAPEHGNSILKVGDGYVIAGDTYSYGNNVTSGITSSDVYLLKTDLKGNLVWNKTFGGINADSASSLLATDDGYVIAGKTNSFTTPSYSDVYLVKTDLNGNLVWSNHYGEAYDDEGRSVISVIDGYVITGYTSSIGNFYRNVYLLKTDLNGRMVWNRTYSSHDMNEGNSIVRAADGSYMIAGYLCTYGVYTSKFYLMKIASDGTPLAATPTPSPSSMPTPKATPTPVPSGGLTTTDLGIIGVVSILMIAIVGAAVVAVYNYRPKK